MRTRGPGRIDHLHLHLRRQGRPGALGHGHGLGDRDRERGGWPTHRWGQLLRVPHEPAPTSAGGPCPAAGVPEDSAVPLVPGAGASSSATAKAFDPNVGGDLVLLGRSTAAARRTPSRPTTRGPPPSTRANAFSWPRRPVTPSRAPRTPLDRRQTFTFQVTTSGSPVPSLKRKGRLPKGVHFVDNHDGPPPSRALPTSRRAWVSTPSPSGPPSGRGGGKNRCSRPSP